MCVCIYVIVEKKEEKEKHKGIYRWLVHQGIPETAVTFVYYICMHV